MKAAFFTGLLFCALKIGAVEFDHSHAPAVANQIASASGLSIRYTDYDWSLNEKPAR